MKDEYVRFMLGDLICLLPTQDGNNLEINLGKSVSHLAIPANNGTTMSCVGWYIIGWQYMC